MTKYFATWPHEPASPSGSEESGKSASSGPSVRERIVKIVSASNERGGVSLAAIKKALAAGEYDVEKNNARVKLAIKKLVANGVVIQTKGTGASGSFKMNKKEAPKTKKKKKKKKPAPKTKEDALLLAEKEQASGSVHCFSKDDGALFVEAVPQTDISRRITAFQYELVPSQGPGVHMYTRLHSVLSKLVKRAARVFRSSCQPFTTAGYIFIVWPDRNVTSQEARELEPRIEDVETGPKREW
ncbi:histone H1.2-like [Synchiropus splendidus]|uniref:histone H1.2-like n=1 Tax=Synchiropus splendidus TaxID=270530 RepID=UPI00237E3C5E|nr:histone H1.2-like [Synchiropus splendidus]